MGVSTVSSHVGCNGNRCDVSFVALRVRSVTPGPWRVVSFIYINICEGGVWARVEEGGWSYKYFNTNYITVRGSRAKLLKTRHSKHPSTRL